MEPKKSLCCNIMWFNIVKLSYDKKIIFISNILYYAILMIMTLGMIRWLGFEIQMRDRETININNRIINIRN